MSWSLSNDPSFRRLCRRSCGQAKEIRVWTDIYRKQGHRNFKVQKFQETNVTLIQPQIDFLFECRETGGNIFFELMALSFGCGRWADNIRLTCKFDDGIYSNQMNLRHKKKTVAAQERRKNFVHLLELRFFTCMVSVFKVHAFTKRREIRRGDKSGTVWSKMRKFSTTPLDLGYRFVSGIMRRNLDQCLINGGLT